MSAKRMSARTHMLRNESHVQTAPAGICPFSFLRSILVFVDVVEVHPATVVEQRPVHTIPVRRPLLHDIGVRKWRAVSVPDERGTDSLQYIQYQFHLLTGFRQKKILLDISFRIFFFFQNVD